jgi:hypothetical protein
MAPRTIVPLIAMLGVLGGEPAKAIAQAQDPYAPFRKVLPSVVRITVQGTTIDRRSVTNHGTGFFVGIDKEARSYILTAFHVVGKDRPNGSVVEWEGVGERKSFVISVEQWSRDETLGTPDKDVRLIRYDKDSDLALLMIAGVYPGAECRHDRLDLGTEVMGIGWKKAPATVYDPIRGSINPGDLLVTGDQYRIAVESQPGHSGGPIFTKEGTVVGVITSGQGPETFATPIERALWLLPEGLVCKQGRQLAAVTRDISEDAKRPASVAWIKLPRMKLKNRQQYPVATFTDPSLSSERSIDLYPEQTMPPSGTDRVLELGSVDGKEWVRIPLRKAGDFAHVPRGTIELEKEP